MAPAPSNAPLIIGALAVLVILFVVLFAVAQAKGGIGKSSDSPASTTTAPPPDPKKALLDSAQAIQVAEFDSQTGGNFATAPTGYSGTPVYTMTMDINIEKTKPSWRNIFGHGPDAVAPGHRKPSVWVSGSASDKQPGNRIHVVHQVVTENTNITSKYAATPGTWFNLTWVVNGSDFDLYINGTKDVDDKYHPGPAGDKYTWPVPDQLWVWGGDPANKDGYGYIKVKNMYFWNKALTADEIKTLTGTTAAASTYTVEPYTPW